MAAPTPDLLRQVVDAENAHDADRLANLFTEDGEFEDYTARLRAKGRDGIRKAFTRLVRETPDLHLELVSSFATDRSYFFESMRTGSRVLDSYGSRSRRYSIRLWSTGELEGGRIRRRRDYWDSGLMPR